MHAMHLLNIMALHLCTWQLPGFKSTSTATTSHFVHAPNSTSTIMLTV